jgi:osmoprotectant transport system ATP-binding protein
MVTHDIDEALKLGDQIVVLKEGGILAQIGSPAELLANPADQFVADFLGESRGYHALNFERISDLAPERTPSAQLGEPVAAPDGAWVVICDAFEKPIAWARAENGIAAADGLSPATPVSQDHGSHRELLDAALSSPAGRAVLVDGAGGYVGTLGSDAVIRSAVDALAEERQI